MQIAGRERKIVSFLLHYILNTKRNKKESSGSRRRRWGTYVGRVVWPLVRGGRRAAQRRAPATDRKASEGGLSEGSRSGHWQQQQEAHLTACLASAAASAQLTPTPAHTPRGSRAAPQRRAPPAAPHEGGRPYGRMQPTADLGRSQRATHCHYCVLGFLYHHYCYCTESERWADELCALHMTWHFFNLFIMDVPCWARISCRWLWCCESDRPSDRPPGCVCGYLCSAVYYAKLFPAAFRSRPFVRRMSKGVNPFACELSSSAVLYFLHRDVPGENNKRRTPASRRQWNGSLERLQLIF